MPDAFRACWSAARKDLTGAIVYEYSALSPMGRPAHSA